MMLHSEWQVLNKYINAQLCCTKQLSQPTRDCRRHIIQSTMVHKFTEYINTIHYDNCHWLAQF